MAADRATGGRRPPRVEVCVDLDDDVDVIRGIHRSFALTRGHLVLTAAPASSADDLIRTMLIALNVLWRLPAKQRPGGVSLNEVGRAVAEWEISWALSRVGITSLWVIDAGQANLFAWLWLRHTVQREDLRLFLHHNRPRPLAGGGTGRMPRAHGQPRAAAEPAEPLPDSLARRYWYTVSRLIPNSRASAAFARPAAAPDRNRSTWSLVSDRRRPR